MSVSSSLAFLSSCCVHISQQKRRRKENKYLHIGLGKMTALYLMVHYRVSASASCCSFQLYDYLPYNIQLFVRRPLLHAVYVRTYSSKMRARLRELVQHLRLPFRQLQLIATLFATVMTQRKRLRHGKTVFDDSQLTKSFMLGGKFPNAAAGSAAQAA